MTGACLADFGNKVLCVDTDASKVERLRQGQVPFFEPGLPEIVARNLREGRLSFDTDLPRAIRKSKVVFITVGTPPRADGSADTSAIYAVAKTVAENLDGFKLVVQKSTAPVGTARDLRGFIRRHAAKGAEFDVASNPEFLREGSAIETFMRPDRVVIGAESAKAAAILKKIHRPLFLIETPMIVTGLETAELIKYASNCFLATKISFINEISAVCEALGADVQMVAKGMGMDRRIGSKFLHAGPGYGGSCFPKDTQALSAFAREAGAKAGIVEATIEANERQMALMVEKVFRAAGGKKGARIGILGVSFKPNTDDMREAPSLTIVAGLKKRGCSIAAYDPVAMPHAAVLTPFRGVEWAKDAYAAARGADAVAIVTEWNEFRGMNLGRLKRAMRRPVLCDLRNLYDPAEVEKAGLTHVGVGRGRPDVAKPARDGAGRTAEKRGRGPAGRLARVRMSERAATAGMVATVPGAKATRRGNGNR